MSRLEKKRYIYGQNRLSTRAVVLVWPYSLLCALPRAKSQTLGKDTFCRGPAPRARGKEAFAEGPALGKDALDKFGLMGHGGQGPSGVAEG